jgi:hypothetical protein
MPSLTGSTVVWLSRRTNLPGCVECCCALRAEPRLGWILEAARWTSVLEGSCTLNAELRDLWIFR